LIKGLVNNRWFALADLMLVSISIVLWELFPPRPWLPLLVALFPWILRLVARKFPFHRTLFDLPLLIFLITAGVGVWVAYNRDIAWAKFWLLVGAVFLFYALAGQPRENIWIVGGIFVLIGTCITVYFLFTHDWNDYPTKAAFLTRAGLWWMDVRPDIRLEGIFPNDAAGVMAVTAPFLTPSVWILWRNKSYKLLVVTLLAGLLIFTGLLMTTTRGAWLALGLVMGASILWLLGRHLDTVVSYHRKGIYSAVLIILLGLIIWVVLLYPNNSLATNSALLNSNTASTRLSLFPEMLDLIGDFPITGGGLGAFPGLYSQYILNIPYFYLPDGHNIFLDIGLEQGLLGLFALVFIFVGSSWLLISSLKTHKLSNDDGYIFLWAIFAGLIVMSLHGSVEDWVYSDRGIPLLLAFPGAAIGFSNTFPDQFKRYGIRSSRSDKKSKWLVPSLTIAILVFGIIGYLLQAPLRSTWYANWGAVLMARYDLASFPSDQWDDGQQVSKLATAETLFQQALQIQPRSRTSLHRLGLIAMLQRDFPKSVAYLETAHRLDPTHRGIIKALGDSYTWAGQLDAAAQLLVKIPEAQHEMRIYAGWWGNQNRSDLSIRAKQMALYLGSNMNQFQETNRP
jgi:hypothetical protein